MDYYLLIAITGTALVATFAFLSSLGLLEADTDFELDNDLESDSFFKFLSIKTISYFLALGGWAAVFSRSLGNVFLLDIIFFLVGGLFAVILNMGFMYILHKLKSENSLLDPEEFKGAQATCVVTIEPHSPGIVHTNVSGKLQEWVAHSEQSIYTGEVCKILKCENNAVTVSKQ